jgi:O-antigen ligase
LIEILIASVIGLAAIYPPLGCEIPMMVNSFLWVYLVLIAGVFGLFLWHIRGIPFSLKVASSYLLEVAFFSTVPYISFNAYIVFSLGLLMYALCVNGCNYKTISKVVQAVFWVQCILLIAQLCGRDTLLNFDRQEQVFLGTVMQYMRCGSLLAILAPFLLVSNRWYILPVLVLVILSESSSFALAIFAGVFVYVALKAKKKKVVFAAILGISALSAGYLWYDWGSVETAFSCGRFPVWGQILRTGMERFWFGWGMGTFSTMFPIVLGETNPFQQAHNSFLQLFWETGIAGFAVFGLYISGLVVRLLRRGKRAIYLAGLACIGTNMVFAFPERMIPTCVLMVAYLAMCERSLRDGGEQDTDCEPCAG